MSPTESSSIRRLLPAEVASIVSRSGVVERQQISAMFFTHSETTKRTKRRILIACLLAASLVGGTWWSISRMVAMGYESTLDSLWPHRHKGMVGTIEIHGSGKFVQQVEESLELVRQQSPLAFELTQRYINSIRQFRRSGIQADDESPTMDLSTKSAYVSLTWCASAIAHDAYHSKLFHEYRDAHGEPVPDDAWRGQAKEMECNAFQLGVLKDIGAPDNEIEHLAKQDGGHFDLDGDGKETWYDYWKRDW